MLLLVALLLPNPTQPKTVGHQYKKKEIWWPQSFPILASHLIYLVLIGRRGSCEKLLSRAELLGFSRHLIYWIRQKTFPCGSFIHYIWYNVCQFYDIWLPTPLERFLLILSTFTEVYNSTKKWFLILEPPIFFQTTEMHIKSEMLRVISNTFYFGGQKVRRSGAVL